MGQYKHAPHFWFEYTAQRKTRRRVPKTVCRRCGRDFSSFPCNYLPLSLASVDFQVWGVQAPSFVDKPITTSRENGGIGRGNMCNGEQHMGTSFKITGFSVRDADSLPQVLTCHFHSFSNSGGSVRNVINPPKSVIGSLAISVQSHLFKVIQEPGELIFVPSGWYHEAPRSRYYFGHGSELVNCLVPGWLRLGLVNWLVPSWNKRVATMDFKPVTEQLTNPMARSK
jgi:hypothetical protein